MRLSVNEVGTLCQRAAAGAGVPFGLAEDAAAASVWLETAGLPGVRVFRRALEGYLAGKSVAVALQPDPGGDRLVPEEAACSGSALFAGPALSDRFLLHASGSGRGSVRACAVDEPLLVMAGTLIAARGVPTSVTIIRAGRNREPVVGECHDDGCTLRAREARDVSSSGPADVSVRFGSHETDGTMPGVLTPAAVENARRRCCEDGIEITGHEYDYLSQHARKILVADSRRSRLSGAGAGLRDND